MSRTIKIQPGNKTKKKETIRLNPLKWNSNKSKKLVEEESPDD